MPPSNFFRAMMPLRSSMTGLTTSASPMAAFLLPQSTRSSLSLTSRRAASTSTEGQQQQQPQQHSTPPSKPSEPAISTKDKVTLPSLRHYPYTLKTGTVASVGKMERTVRVAYHHTTYDPQIRKTYRKVTHYLVADPQDSLREGDVIEFSSGFPKSRTVHHVVERIIAPFESPIDQRPAVLSREERDALREKKRAAKWQRREERKAQGTGEGVNEHIGRIRKLVSERPAAE